MADDTSKWNTRSSFPRPHQPYFQLTQIIYYTIAIMGVLAESWQTPYSATSYSHCAVTGGRIDMHPARSNTPKTPRYHRLYREDPPKNDASVRGGPKDDPNPGTRSPTEETKPQEKNIKSHSRIWIEGEGRARDLLMDVLHSIPKAQRAGIFIPDRPVRIG
ncbi:hypothetical protein HD554DRAFT_10882 [Boletus coccyginus]|nr:hypothetical protein HD554DRAFT_10882 [Boletus coccyginus]